MIKRLKLPIVLTLCIALFVSSALALNPVKLNPEYFPNPAIGRALSGAQIYVGIVDLDPKIPANQKTLSVLQENGTTVAVTQPLSTGAGGVPVYNGSPVTMLVDGSYSLRVDDSTGSQVYYVPKNAELESVLSLDSIADLRAITTTPTDGDAFTVLGYYTPGDGGGGQFYWDATSTATDNGGTIIKVTSITTGRWVRLFNVVTLEKFGAYGDKTTDDTTFMENALAYIASSGGGTIVGSDDKTYRFTTALTLPENLILDSVKLYADITAATDHALSAIGTAGTPTLLTSDVVTGDNIIPVTSTSEFSVDGYLIIEDDRWSGRHPKLFLKITDITALNLTVDMKSPVDYLTANSATVTPITPVENIRLDNVDIECSDSVDIKNVLFFEYANNINIENKLRITNHNYPTNPTAAVVLRSDNSREVHYDNVYIEQQAASTGGNGAYLFACTLSSIRTVKTVNTSFGIGIWDSFGVDVIDCNINGKRLSGNRGIKFAGSQGCKASGNTTNGFDSGFKIQDTGTIIVTKNTVRNCGIGSSSSGINISNTVASGQAVRGINISHNEVYEINGIGIRFDSASTWARCIGNEIRNTLFGGILSEAQRATISLNRVENWGSGSGIAFERTSTVTNNAVFDPDSLLSSYEISADTRNVTDYTTFTGNLADGNGLLTNPLYFDGVAVNHSNNIANRGQRVMWGNLAPTGGTFVNGDRMYDDSPTAGNYIGWVCTGSGTPGTWKRFGSVVP